MTTQMLFYKSVVPLSAAQHHDCSIEPSVNYDFTAKINSVPLMAVEFPQAATEYAIVFAGSDDNIVPAVILGLKHDQNLFVSNNDAAWGAKYKPAFVRRYPFVFSTTPDGQRFILCIDEAFSGFNREGRGQKLFDAENKHTPFVDNVLKFLQEYQVQFRRTRDFCKKVRELDLLEPMQAQVEMRSGERISLGGFMAVNRTKLKALASDKLAELAKTDELELLYLHLQSMRNISGLPERLAEHSVASAPASESNSNKKPRGSGKGSGGSRTSNAKSG
jgi:hypothetical protein